MKSTDLLEFVVNTLRAKSFPVSEIAKLSGVPVRTINCIKAGDTTNPRWETVKALAITFGAK